MESFPEGINLLSAEQRRNLKPASRLSPPSPLYFSEARRQGGSNYLFLICRIQRVIDLKTAFGGLKSNRITTLSNCLSTGFKNGNLLKGVPL